MLQQQVGGAGLGFGPSRADPLQELIGSRPGFTKGEAPSPATMPEAPLTAAPAATAAAATANPYASMYGGGGGAAAASPAPADRAGDEPAQGAGPAEPSGAGGVWGGRGLKTMLQGKATERQETALGQFASVALAPPTPFHCTLLTGDHFRRGRCMHPVTMNIKDLQDAHMW